MVSLDEIKGSLDLRLYAGLPDHEIRRRLRGDLKGFASEHEKDGLRVKPYEIIFGSSGEPNFKLRWETETDFLENEAVYAIRRLAMEGNDHIIWISPPSEKVGYDDTRFVEVFVKKREKGEVVVECRGIYGQQTAQECLDIARSLGVEIKDKEELRAMPIAFKPEVEDVDWIDFLEKRVQLRPGVWENIRNGEDVKIDAERSVEIDKIIEAIMPSLRSKYHSRTEAVLVGVKLERMIESRLNIQLLTGGSCDKTNLGILQMLSRGPGAFNFIFSNSMPGLVGGKYFSCPKCNGNIESGKGIEKCPHCGTTKQEAGSVCD